MILYVSVMSVSSVLLTCQKKYLFPSELTCRKKNSTLDGLFLDEDSPYALSRRTVGCHLIAGHALTNHSKLFARRTNLHCLQRQRFPRSRTVVGPSVDHTWQADLVEMQDPKLVRTNCRSCYLLIIIDVLSKHAWVVGLKSKRSTAVCNASFAGKQTDKTPFREVAY